LGDLRDKIAGVLRKFLAHFGLISTRKDEAQGLLSASDMILLYLYREGQFKGSKADLARAVDFEESWGSRKVNECLSEGWIQETKGVVGFELTRAGRHRMRPFTVSRVLLTAIAIPASSLLLALALASEFYGTTVPASDFLIASIGYFVGTWVFWYYQRMAERQILKRKPRE
jgi:hypothetical protein